MTNIPKQYQDDVIDPQELLATLWKGKLLILVITALFSIAGITYAFLAHQEWNAKAVVIAPMPLHVEQLRQRIENIKAVNPSVGSGPDHFSTTFSQAKLFTDFIESFNSFDNRCEFLDTDGYIREGGTKDARSRQRFLEKMAKKFTATIKKKETFYTLSSIADNAPEAKKRLSAYLDFIQAKEVAIKNQQLNVEIANQSQSVALKRQILKVDALKRLHDEITRTEFALRISKAAGLETPVENLYNETIFPIQLGAKALNEQLQILKEINDPEIINPELADIRKRFDGLQALPLKTAKFTSYHLLQSPAEPLSRDKPKRSLVVALATLAGLMVGIVVAQFRGSLK